MTTQEVKIHLSVSGSSQVQGSLAGVEGGLNKLTVGVQRLGHYAAALFVLPQMLNGTVGAFIRAGDAVTQLNNQLRLATGSAQAASAAYSALFGIAQRSRVSFVDLGNTFASISRSAGELGIGQARLLTVTEAIGNAMAIGGGSAQAMNAALVQLGQGFASGVLRGEELNSVMEQTPRLAKAIADGMGITIGQLRAMGNEGRLTAQAIVGALESQASTLAGEVQGSVLTVGQAITQLGNAAMKLVGQVDAATGASRETAKAASAASGELGRMAEVMEMTARGGGGKLEQLARAGGLGVMRTTLHMVEGSASALNWTINALTGNMLGLSEQIDITPLALKTTAEQAQILGQRLADAERELAGLNKRFAAGDRSIYLRSEIGDLQRYIAALKEARGEKLALLGGPGATGSAPSGDTALARANAQIRAGQQKAYDELMRTLATPQEKLAAEVKKQQELLGELYTPDVDARIRAQFATRAAQPQPSEAQEYLATLARQTQQLEEQRITASEGAAAWERYRAAQLGVSAAAQQHIAANAKLRDELAATAAATAAEREAIEAVYRARLDAGRQAGEHAKSLAEQARQQREETLRAGMTEQAYRALGIARLEEQLRLAELVVQQNEYLQLCTAETEAHKDTVTALRELIDARRAAAGAEDAQAAKRAADAVQAEWQKSVDQMGQSLSDALMNGGRSAADYLKGLFRNLILRPIVMPVATAVSSFTSGPAAAAGTLGGVGGIGSAIGGLVGSVGSAGAAAGLGASLSLGGQALGTTLAASGSLIGGGSIASGLGLGLGAIAPYAIGAYALYALGKKLFGRKLADTGVEGTMGAAGFAGSSYAYYKGGLLRSDKTTRGALDPALDAVLDAGATAAHATVQAYVQALGLPVEAIAGYTKQIRLSLAGKSQDEIKAAIDEAVAGFAGALADVYQPILEPFRKAGEEIADTLARLAGLQTFAVQLAALGGAFGKVAGLGFDARESLIALSGGMDALLGKATAFAQRYYSRDEIAGLKAREIGEQLRAAGIAADFGATGDLRSYLEGLDLSTEAGRKQFSTLLDVAPDFADVADYMAEAGTPKTLSGAAALAPANALLQGQAQDQISAINTITLTLGGTNELLRRIEQVLIRGQRAGGPAPAVAIAAPEVNAGQPWGQSLDYLAWSGGGA